MSSDGLFKRLSQHVPFSDMTRVMLDFPADMTVRDMLQWIHEDFVGAVLKPVLRDALMEARAQNRLSAPPSCDPAHPLAGSDTMRAMTLMAQGFRPNSDDVDLLTKPLLRAFESEVIWAANENKKVGLVQPHHLDAPVHIENFWRRLIRAEHRLAMCIASGTTEDWHMGAVETLDDGWSARFRLDDWHLSADMRAPGRVGWKPELQSDALIARRAEIAAAAAERAREKEEEAAALAP